RHSSVAAPHATPARLDRRAQLRPADIVERCLDPVRGAVLQRRQVAHLECQEDDRADADRDEDADPEVDGGAIQLAAPRNMKTVRTKSSARIASDAPTTVRVVAVETPSA